MERRITKILIANRGEIACRIIKTCKSLGINTAVVFSDVDENALFVSLADEAVRIGGKQPNESYLDQDKIMNAAKSVHADAIHPGYGFLSENAAFAERCQSEDIIWIGPHSKAIEAMGSKIKAKEIMSKAGVPVIPGYNGANQDEANLKAEALKIGFPVLLKASAGGGGKGMRVVREASELDKAMEAAKREAKNAFGDDQLLIEKFFDSSRHIEIQIFGDKHGNYLHFGERECSIQRRHQKVIEECPSPILSEEKRKEMGHAAVKAAEAIQYDNAGTVEFIYTNQDEFYFLEVNTRLQVEHPVTEMVTGHDLVEHQINVAEGQPLPITQEDIQFNGHAIECRLYAEDPNNDYLPVTGTILQWEETNIEGIRYDTGIQTGSEISVFYDPMIAKIISYGKDRKEAIQKIEYAIRNLTVSGLTTNKKFLIKLMNEAAFKQADFDTGYLDKHFQYKKETSKNAIEQSLTAAVCWEWANRKGEKNLLKEVPMGWRNLFYEAQKTSLVAHDEKVDISYTTKRDSISIQFNDSTFEAKAILLEDQLLKVEINNIKRVFSIVENAVNIFVHNPILGDVTLGKVPRFVVPGLEMVKGGYTAPMPGQVIEVKVNVGDKVNKGDILLVLLSMKMENAIEAMDDGIIEEIFVAKDAFVEADTMMIKVKED